MRELIIFWRMRRWDIEYWGEYLNLGQWGVIVLFDQ